MGQGSGFGSVEKVNCVLQLQFAVVQFAVHPNTHFVDVDWPTGGAAAGIVVWSPDGHVHTLQPG